MQTVAARLEIIQRPKITAMSCTALRERPLGTCLRTLVTHSETLIACASTVSFCMHDGSQASQQLLAWHVV